VASIGWKTRLPTMRPDFRGVPKAWPQDLNQIVNPLRSWPSPGAKQYFNSTTAWAWLQAYWLDGFKRQGLPINASWLSRLVSEQHILQRGAGRSCSLCLAVGPFALVALDLRQVGPHAWHPDRGPECVHWVFVTDVRQFLVVPARPVFIPHIGICFEELGKPEPLVRSALRRRLEIAREDLRTLCVLLDLGVAADDGKTSKRELLEILACASFEDATERARILESYMAPPPPEETIDLSDVAEDIEELALNDHVNSSELVALRADLQKTTLRKLNALRREEFRKRQERRAKAKTKGGTRRLGGNKRRGFGVPAALGRKRRRMEASAIEGAGRVEPLPLPAPLIVAEESESLAVPPPVLGLESAGAEIASKDLPDAQVGNPASVPVGPAPAAPLQRDVRYSTPELLRRLAPPLPGFSISMDQHACRWRCKANGENLPSVGFGPQSGLDRLESLKLALTQLWAAAGVERPSESRPEEIPWACWGGLLDARVETPKPYRKRNPA